MPRIWGSDYPHASRESMMIRRWVTDGLRWAGMLLICRQVYTQVDYDNDLVEHCEYCWDPVLKQISNSRCPHCFGTGYEGGGYKPPFMVRAHLAENSRRDFVNEKQGFRESEEMTIKLPYLYDFHDGDVFAEVRETDGKGVPTALGRMFQLEGALQQKTVQGIVSNNIEEGYMRLEDSTVAQEATVKLILPTDERYAEMGFHFWGLDAATNPDIYLEPDVPYVEDLTDRKDRYHESGWVL